MADWQFDERSRRYRDASSGRYLSASSAVELRDDVVLRLRKDADLLTRQLASQDISVQAWEAQMAQNVREVTTVQYALGRGGRNAMTDADRTALAEIVSAQNDYLRGFAQDVTAGDLSEAQISARSKLYYGASTAAYEHGKASSWGVELPHHPADGSTPCASNCKCYVSYADKPDAVHVTWHRTAKESCQPCRQRASTWTPLVIAKASGGRTARLYRMVASSSTTPG